MLKKAGIPVLSATLILGTLTGCGANKKEFAEGIALYNEGTYESLIESQKFFIDYIETNGDSKGAKKWLNNVNKTLLTKAEKLTDEAYEAQDFEAALEYVEVGRSIDPSSKKFKSAHTLVTQSLKEQQLFDEYADYLEDVYVYVKTSLNTWETFVKNVETGQMNVSSAKNLISNIYMDIVELREVVNNKTFELTNSNTTHYKQVNLKLFEYVTNIERELSNCLSKTDTSIKSLSESFNNFSATEFSKRFSNIADDMLNYTTEKNAEGEAFRNIKYTLNFTDAYEDFLEKKNGKTTSEERAE